jgi:hypothetical protein
MFVGSSASYVSAKRLLFAPRTNSNNPYGVSGPLGAGARAVTGALDCVFASTDGHATCSNVVSERLKKTKRDANVLIGASLRGCRPRIAHDRRVARGTEHSGFPARAPALSTRIARVDRTRHENCAANHVAGQKSPTAASVHRCASCRASGRDKADGSSAPMTEKPFECA